METAFNPPGSSEVTRGVYRKSLNSGATFIGIATMADPSKDAVWLEGRRMDMLTEPDIFRRHYLGDMTVVSGEPVYSNYDDRIHCPEKYRESGIPIVPGSLYFGGWDCGQSLCPAFTLLQVTANPFQVHAILELISPGGESMEQFAPRVGKAIMKRLPGAWDQIRHYADATVTTKSGTNGKSAQYEAKKHGFEGPTKLRPVSNAWLPRYGAVTWLLSRQIALPGDQTVAGFFLDARHCQTLRQGFQGHYKWRVSAQGDDKGPGQVILEPLKNNFSHVHDSLQYPAIKIRRLVEGGGGTVHTRDGDEDDE